MSKIALIFLLAAVAVAMSGERVIACAVPVFRYALERWEPDTYFVVVRHDKALTAAQRALVEELRAAATDPTNPANLAVVVLDQRPPAAEGLAAEPDDTSDDESSSSDAEPTEDTSEATAFEETNELDAVERQWWLDLLESIDVPTLSSADESPQMLLLMPLPGRPPHVVWHGPLSHANCRRLIDSPARQTIVRQILDGQSAVWVLLASGKEDADARAEETLRKELARMEELLQLPSPEELAMEPSYRADSAVELRIGFSVVVLKTDDLDEAIFRAMILASEPDLVDFHEPIAVPVFGRGRTCFALVGRGIHPDMIEENCRFLCDGCSCVIKQENPGVDLLLAANWDALITGSAILDLVLPELTGIGELPSDSAAMAEEVMAEEVEAAAKGAATEAAHVEPTAVESLESRPAAILAVAPPNEATPGASGRFNRNLLLWTLAGTGVVALVVGLGTVWINKRR